ncbi:class II glutamine amidotransferase [Ancylobacter amanitiformis]|uniref:Glutamate synthase domain-containing protein 1 n=1 Tax=Ancylobacter amanitiformis TaxID=217069 RepID=A0ABU0LV28_9HYPH|nr:glutamine amidotransferase family protein [Ancylobacter amanitiformis]MDQ0512558.1 glutamate synthase domain-containing protein 1 [Ancylobacter amanitiformis]
MCGIVGLFLKDPKLEPELGAMLAEMLDIMCDRGPDSAGFAVYGAGAPGFVKLTLRGPAGTDFTALGAASGHAVTPRDTHAVLNVPVGEEATVRAALGRLAPEIRVVGVGQRMELYKEVGLPADVARRFKLETMAGTHAIGHTRMATESAVTTEGAHPFSTGPDQCLVHNGSLSNHAGVRRRLAREGFRVDTENDSEVAAAYLTYRMRGGDTLGEALTHSLDDLDGFYTFVVGTENGFGVLRDPIACKPAVMAETDGYVAFGSEYRALAGLPGIATAKLWEPEPAKVYFWDRAA